MLLICISTFFVFLGLKIDSVEHESEILKNYAIFLAYLFQKDEFSFLLRMISSFASYSSCVLLSWEGATPTPIAVSSVL